MSGSAAPCAKSAVQRVPDGRDAALAINDERPPVAARVQGDHDWGATRIRPGCLAHEQTAQRAQHQPVLKHVLLLARNSPSRAHPRWRPLWNQTPSPLGTTSCSCGACNVRDVRPANRAGCKNQTRLQHKRGFLHHTHPNLLSPMLDSFDLNNTLQRLLNPSCN